MDLNHKKVYLSELARPVLKDYLSANGFYVEIVKKKNCVYEQVSSHPDLYMCKMGVEPESPIIFAQEGDLGYQYPENIAFNAVCLGQYFIHNLQFTNFRVLKAAERMQMNFIHVNQGYTKCNTIVVDESSLITSDEGIVKALSRYTEIQVLQVRQGYVTLKGFPYGFLGGASGRVGNTVIFNGDISIHPDYAQISAFICSRGLKIKYFKEFALEDIGSIIELFC